MRVDRTLPDLVHDAKIETNVTGNCTEHVFYEPGESPMVRRKRRVEHWIRDVVLGKGAYGIVYKEKRDDGKTQTFRAVKEISKSVVHGEQLDYIRELEAIMKFSHHKYSHCFVRSDGWFEQGDSIFIVMEHIELGNLQRHLTKPLPETETRQITAQVLEGLNFMHDNGFVHRDLKPGNIMVVSKEPKWYVKIADFGISKRRQQGITTLHTLQRGTLGFAAPEVLGSKPGEGNGSYTFAVDMWSLGAVTYYMLTQTMVFEEVFTIFLYATGAATLPVGSLEQIGVSESGRDFVTGLLAPLPASRPSASVAFKHAWLARALPTTMEEPSIDTSTSELTAKEDIPTIVSEASLAWSIESMQNEKEPQTVKLIKTPTHHSQSFENMDGKSEIKILECLPRYHPDVLEEVIQQSSVPVAIDHDNDAVVYDPTLNRDGSLVLRPRSGDFSGMSEQIEEDVPVRTAILDDASVSESDSSEELVCETMIDQPSQLDLPALKENEDIGELPKHDVLALNEEDLHYLSRLNYKGQSSAVILNWRRELAYTRKTILYFVDVQGRIWYAPDPLPPGNNTFTQAGRIKDFWRRQEELGYAKLLCHLETHSVEATQAQSPQRSGLCFVCQIEFPPEGLAELPCTHRHCFACLSWAFQFSATDARISLPRCCSKVIPFGNVKDNLAKSYDLFSAKLLSVHCQNPCCRREFGAFYTARSPWTREWLVYCPDCCWGVCLLCRGVCQDHMHWDSYYGCPTRSQFRDKMTAALHIQEPNRRVLYDTSWTSPGIRLDPEISDTEIVPDLALPGIRGWSTRQVPVIPIQKTTTRELLKMKILKSCRQCGRIRSMSLDIELLDCGHLMCRPCILHWFTLGLISPTHVTPLCFSCPVSPPVIKLDSVYERIGIRPSFIILWDNCSKLRRQRSWKCAISPHPQQKLLYEPRKPLSWKQWCEDCRFHWCLRCNTPWHDHSPRLCNDAEAAENFYRWLFQVNKPIDPVLNSFMSLALAKDREMRQSEVECQGNCENVSEPQTELKNSTLDDEYEPLFFANKRIDSDCFSMQDGSHGESNYLEGVTLRDVLEYLDTVKTHSESWIQPAGDLNPMKKVRFR